MKTVTRALLARATLVTLAALACGCASMSPIGPTPAGGTAQASAKPVPRVQDCGVLSSGSPSRFVCNGKGYSSYQLAKLRETETKKYASGQ